MVNKQGNHNYIIMNKCIQANVGQAIKNMSRDRNDEHHR